MSTYRINVKRTNIEECICNGKDEEEAIKNALNGDVLKTTSVDAVDDEFIDIELIGDD